MIEEFWLGAAFSYFVMFSLTGIASQELKNRTQIGCIVSLLMMAVYIASIVVLMIASIA